MENASGYTIAFKGLKSGTHDFDFKVGGELFASYEASDIKGGDCDVHVVLDRSETRLQIAVAIKGEVTVECDRCLDDCPIPIDYEGELVVKFSDEECEYDGEVMWLPTGESEVDLAQYIYESIILSLPYQRVHPDGGCNPEMTARFNIVSSEEFARIEAEAEKAEEGTMPASEMEKLAALKAQMENDNKADHTERK